MQHHRTGLRPFRLETGLQIAEVSASHSSPVDVESPAWEVATDLTLVKAASAQPSDSLRRAEELMIAHGVRMLFVLGEDERIAGLVTLTDLHGDRAVRLVQERGLHYGDLFVADVMTELGLLDAVDFDELKTATVGDVVATLKRFGRNHMLVVQSPTHATPRRVRAVISRSQIERQLGEPIEVVPVARNFAEIERALHHA